MPLVKDHYLQVVSPVLGQMPLVVIEPTTHTTPLSVLIRAFRSSIVPFPFHPLWQNQMTRQACPLASCYKVRGRRQMTGLYDLVVVPNILQPLGTRGQMTRLHVLLVIPNATRTSTEDVKPVTRLCDLLVVPKATKTSTEDVKPND